MKLTEYTLEVYKVDRRLKTGLRRVDTVEVKAPSQEAIQQYVNFTYGGDPTLVVKVFETYVTKINALTNKEFTERYDTPYYASPSSEAYWCN